MKGMIIRVSDKGIPTVSKDLYTYIAFFLRGCIVFSVRSMCLAVGKAC